MNHLSGGIIKDSVGIELGNMWGKKWAEEVLVGISGNEQKWR